MEFSPGPNKPVPHAPGSAAVVGHVGQLTQAPRPSVPIPPQTFNPPKTPSAPPPPVQPQAAAQTHALTPQPTTLIAQAQTLDHMAQISVSVTSLPSKGLSYPPSSTVRHRPYTFGEVKRINQNDMTLAQAIEMVLSGVETIGFPKESLTLADALYVGLLRRISTIGTAKGVVPYRCGHCSRKASQTLELGGPMSVIEFDDLPIPELPIIIDMSKGERRFMPLTVSQYLQVLVPQGKQEDEIACLAAECVGVDFESAEREFNDATADDAALLNEVDRLLYHGVKAIPVNCPNCGGMVSLELDGGQSLILPFRGAQEPLKSRVHFGKRAGG